MFDFKLYAQYTQMFLSDAGNLSPQNAPQKTNDEPEVIKLFDE